MNQSDQSPTETRGVLITIGNDSRLQLQVLGTLNEAEFLGIGAYLNNVLIRDGILALSQNQVAATKSIEQVAKVLEELSKDLIIDQKSGDESCGKESSSDS